NMLGYLGFVVRIEVDTSREDACLQVFTEEEELLLGPRGDRLDDIQYLVNRILLSRDESAPRIRVDVNHRRSMSEDELIEEAEGLAARVINSGRAAKLQPLNSYHRRIVHNHFKNHPEVKTWSPSDQARLKRVTIMMRDSGKKSEDKGGE
ncbi:MAG: R3H domain-containing nucleic acid-binding protein, partial [Verrucomicrobiota bacterium]